MYTPSWRAAGAEQAPAARRVAIRARLQQRMTTSICGAHATDLL